MQPLPLSLEDLRNLVHTSEVPERLLCRDEETRHIKQFVISAVSKSAKGHAMYISGVPGTGKTLATKNIVESTSHSNVFSFVYVNAMELMDPNQVFTVIYKTLFEAKSISASNAHRKLNAIFQTVDITRRPILILVDELDMLCTPGQEIIYDIFNWVVNDEARVSVIGISNTLDLPERVLSQRISSRLGFNRVIFQPYTYNQIEEIVHYRLQGARNLIHHDAIQSTARRVASISGDIRRALDIIRRSAEIAIARDDETITIEHVNATFKELSSTFRVSMVVSLPQHSLILFRAVVAQVECSGYEENSFIDVYKQYRILCTALEGIAPYQEYGCYTMVMRMCSNRLLLASAGTNCMTRVIRLGLTVQDALYAIKMALHKQSEVPPFNYEEYESTQPSLNDVQLQVEADNCDADFEEPLLYSTSKSSIEDGDPQGDLVDDSYLDLELPLLYATSQSSIEYGDQLGELVGEWDSHLMEDSFSHPSDKDIALEKGEAEKRTAESDSPLDEAFVQLSITEGQPGEQNYDCDYSETKADEQLEDAFSQLSIQNNRPGVVLNYRISDSNEACETTSSATTVSLEQWQRAVLEFDQAIDLYRMNNVDFTLEGIHDRHIKVMVHSALERLCAFLAPLRFLSQDPNISTSQIVNLSSIAEMRTSQPVKTSSDTVPVAKRRGPYNEI